MRCASPEGPVFSQKCPKEEYKPTKLDYPSVKSNGLSDTTKNFHSFAFTSDGDFSLWENSIV